MLRFFAFLLYFLSGAALAAVPQTPAVAGRAWIVADITSGQILTAQKADERFETASLTKLLTAYVVFTALRERKITLTQQLPISQRAWRAPGSRMFVDPRKPVTVDELIRGMVVQSGNDACIALAEAIAGSEPAFVEIMNREAARLGMKNSNFRNVSGLPDAQQYSTARDLYALSAALIRDYPNEYATYYSQKDYRYNNVTQPNPNTLLWMDPTVAGGRPGNTRRRATASSPRRAAMAGGCSRSCSAQIRKPAARANRRSSSTGASSSTRPSSCSVRRTSCARSTSGRARKRA